MNKKRKFNKIVFGRVSIKEKAVFTKNLSIMLQSGLTIIEALDILGEQSGGKLKIIIGHLRETVAAGNPLSSALAEFSDIFSGFYLNTVKSGEASGNLDENLRIISEQLIKRKNLVEKIRAAMVYPSIVIILSFALGIVVSYFVLPKITPLFTGLKMDLPVTTKALIWFSDLMRDYGGIIIALCFFGSLFLAWFLRRKIMRPITHFVILHLPIIGRISRLKNLAIFNRTFGMLLRSGLGADEAIAITAQTVENYYFKKSLKRISARIGQGANISNLLGLEHVFFPKLTISLVRVGERSGKLEEELLNLAEIYEADVDSATKSLSVMIEPILLVFIGIIVGGLALSIITPIYQITGNIYR